MHKTIINDPVPEEASATITAQVVDENDAALPNSALSTCTMTLYNETDGAIINLRNGTNVLGDVDSLGKLTRTLTPDDQVILNTKRAFERHVAQFDWTYGGGKVGRALVVFVVENLHKVT